MVAELVVVCCMMDPRLALKVSEVAHKQGVPEDVFHALVMTESDYRKKAVSRGNGTKSYGLTQLTLATAKRFCGIKTIKSVLDVDKNLNCGARVFKHHLKRTSSITKALEAYNSSTRLKDRKRYSRKVLINLRKINDTRDVDI